MVPRTKTLLRNGFDESSMINMNSSFIAKSLGIENVESYRVGEGDDVAGKARVSFPLEPDCISLISVRGNFQSIPPPQIIMTESSFGKLGSQENSGHPRLLLLKLSRKSWIVTLRITYRSPSWIRKDCFRIICLVRFSQTPTLVLSPNSAIQAQWIES